jgi:hypothetical protein
LNPVFRFPELYLRPGGWSIAQAFDCDPGNGLLAAANDATQIASDVAKYEEIFAAQARFLKGEAEARKVG